MLAKCGSRKQRETFARATLQRAVFWTQIPTIYNASRIEKKEMGKQKLFFIGTEATRMWPNAQRDGRPAEHRWRPLFNAAKFG